MLGQERKSRNKTKVQQDTVPVSEERALYTDSLESQYTQ